MLIQVDYNSGEPVSRQVVAQVKWMVASGRLRAGDKLPSIRELSKQLKVNPTTITRIYGELSADKVIVLKQGHGAFVSSQSATGNRTEARKQVRELIRRMLAEGIRLGLAPDDLQQLIDHEFEKLSKETS